MKELADDVRVEPIREGFLASSRTWGVSGAGATHEQALERLGKLILLVEELDRRVAAQASS